MRGLAWSADRLAALHAAGKLFRKQPMSLGLPSEPDIPKPSGSVIPPEQVSHDAAVAEGDVRDDWVSELVQRAADASLFTLKCGTQNGDDKGALPACG